MPKADPAIQSAPVKVRVLVACEYGAPNDVVEIDSALAATMTDVVDADPAAVEYAESLKA